MILLKPIFIIALVTVAMIGVMVPSVFAQMSMDEIEYYDLACKMQFTIDQCNYDKFLLSAFIDNTWFMVVSGSMVPVMHIGDGITIEKIPFEEVEIGDIIVFDRPSDHNRVIVHRVVSITNEDPRTIRTQGDANPGSIPGTDFPITEEEYIGKVAYIIPQVGYIGHSPNYIIIIVMYVGIIFGVVLFKRQKFQETLDSELPSSTAASPKESQEENITDIDKQIAINEEKIRKIEEESKKLD